MSVGRLLALGAALLGLVPLGLAPSASAFDGAAVDEHVLDVEIIGISPTPVTPGSTFTVTAAVTNRTDTALDGSVSLHAQSYTPSSRVGMLRWLDPTLAATRDLTSVELPHMTPGTRSEVRFEVEGDSLGASTWGPRGIEVRSTPADATQSGDAERSWVVWWDEPVVAPAEFTALVPLAPTSEDLSAGLEPSRYASLAAAGSSQAVTLLVDPSLLAEDGDTVRALREAGEVWALPWADADTSALLGADRWSVAEDAATRSEQRLAELGIESAGPVERTVNGSTALAEASFGPVLLTASTVEDWYVRGTPCGVTTLDGADALVLDQFMQDALNGKVEVDGRTVQLDRLQAQQLLAATTAAQVRESPSTSRLLAVVTPADDDGTAAALVAGLAELPWLEPLHLSAIDTLRADAEDISDRVTLPTAVPSGRGVTAAELDLASALTADFESFSSILADAASVQVPEFDQLETLPSRALADQPQRRDTLLEAVRTSVDELRNGLEIAVPASLLMVSETSNFPVTVINHLPEDATVRLSLEATDRRLQQAEDATITVRSGHEVRAEIPVTAVGSGDLTAEVQLLTPDGDPIGEPRQLQVQMRAEWEGFGLVALIVAGVVSFVVGLWRTVQRNRREDRAAEMKEAVEIYEAHIAEEEARAEEES